VDGKVGCGRPEETQFRALRTIENASAEYGIAPDSHGLSFTRPCNETGKFFPYMHMCETGSLQSEAPVLPPRARMEMV